MAEDVTPTPEQTPPAEPTPFAGKYKTVEELERGYKELEAKLGQPAPAAPTPPVAAPAPTDPNALSLQGATEEPASIGDVLARAGLAGEQVAKEWTENKGQLSAESYAKLAAQGIPRLTADLTAQASQVLAVSRATAMRNARSTSAQLLGGEEQLGNLITWAKANIPQHERADMEGRLGDPERMVGAVADIYRRQQEVTGGAATQDLVPGGPAPAAQGQGMSATEWAEAMQKLSNGEKLDDATMARLGATDAETIQSRSR